MAVLAAACNTGPDEGLSAETEFEVYGTDSDILVTITNESNNAVAYRACPSIWERQSNNDRVQGLQVCTDEITTVDAQSSVDVTYTFPVGQPLGSWRIVIPVGPSDDDAEIRTNDFEMVVTAE
jgi:hypothetical protein